MSLSTSQKRELLRVLNQTPISLDLDESKSELPDQVFINTIIERAKRRGGMSRHVTEDLVGGFALSRSNRFPSARDDRTRREVERLRREEGKRAGEAADQFMQLADPTYKSRAAR